MINHFKRYWTALSVRIIRSESGLSGTGGDLSLSIPRRFTNPLIKLYVYFIKKRASDLVPHSLISTCGIQILNGNI